MRSLDLKLKEAPFTENERRLWLLLSQVYKEFDSLEQTHPSDKQEVIDGIHKMQDVLIKRVSRREWPGSCAGYRKLPTGWVLRNEPS